MTRLPDVSKSIKSHFYINSWTFASGVTKWQFFNSYGHLTLMPRLHLNFQNHNFAQAPDGWPSCRAARPNQICILPHVGLPVLKIVHIPPHVGRPTHAISTNGCRGQRRFALHHATCLPIRHGRSPQRVAQGQTRPAFRHTFGRPTRCRW